MSSWFQRATGSTQAQFAATALVSGAVVAGAIFGYQAVQRRERLQDLKAGIPEVGAQHLADKVSEAEEPSKRKRAGADGRSKASGLWGRDTIE